MAIQTADDRPLQVTFLLWKWLHPTYRARFNATAVNVLAASIRRTCTLKHRIICVTDDPRGVNAETYPLWNDHATLSNPSGKHLPNCYRRLRMFDVKTQIAMGIAPGSRVVSMDLDCVIVAANIDPLFSKDGDFMAWQVKGQMQPKVYNGSLVGFTAGSNQHLWDEFDPIRSPALASNNGFFGSDQGWLSYKKIGQSRTNQWTVERDGVFSFPREIKQRRSPWSAASLVFFNGREKPWDPDLQKKHPWIPKYWRL